MYSIPKKITRVVSYACALDYIIIIGYSLPVRPYGFRLNIHIVTVDSTLLYSPSLAVVYTREELIISYCAEGATPEAPLGYPTHMVA